MGKSWRLLCKWYNELFLLFRLCVGLRDRQGWWKPFAVMGSWVVGTKESYVVIRFGLQLPPLPLLAWLTHAWNLGDTPKRQHSKQGVISARRNWAVDGAWQESPPCSSAVLSPTHRSPVWSLNCVAPYIQHYMSWLNLYSTLF